MIGLSSKKVKIVEYTSDWKKEYNQEKEILCDLLKSVIVEIEHVGSTTIPNCAAKPVIDIAIGVKSKNDFEIVKSILLKAGYYHSEKAGAEDRMFFSKGEEDNRTHNIHVDIYKGISWNYHVNFRDYMIENPDEIVVYSQLKKQLQKKYENNRKEYTKSKDEYIKMVLCKYNEL